MTSKISLNFSPSGKPQATIESLVAQSYNEIPYEERNELLNELHGVADEFVETPQLIQDRLRELENELKMITDKPEYEMAYSTSPDFVNSTSFRMMFLRSELFDVKRSAKRMVFHFRDKLAIFGRDLLTREILLSDLSLEEVEFFKQGRQQPLLQRDRGGRLLLFVVRQLEQEKMPMASRLRITWYYLMCCLDGDELTQKRGMVLIWWFISKDTLTYTYSETAKLVSLYRSLPLRLAGTHICSNDSRLRPFLNFGAQLLEHRLRLRLRFHFGTPQEVIYALMTFGVPREILPIGEDGTTSSSLFHIWLEMRAEREKNIKENYDRNRLAATSEVHGVIVPGHFDVLLGRGKAIESSPGNNHLRFLISNHYEKYDEAARGEKNVICLWILGMIQKKGGKFMIKSGSHGWVEVPEAKAIDKISHDFRNYRVRGVGTLSSSNERQGTATKRSMDWN
ncbi:hypothetical protein IV203_029532 [Nitzschia inconspicua]|uniref:DUF6824 domain-containing protein n=1 Tax=Nitzschia inconspicua TaxID=303405 RepID=A0A9K3LR92_9STRA|nr:hypothetical protein IV203_029532 [Nitzschia inconspicua]